MKVEPKQLDALLHPTFNPEALKAATPITTGLPASPGAACGAVYFTADAAAKAHTDRPQGRSGPSGDLPGGHRRHGSFRGHHDRTRRHDLSRSRCCTRHGHLLCLPAASGITVSEEDKTITFAVDGTRCQGRRRISRSTARPVNVYLGAIATQEAESDRRLTAASWAGLTSIRTLHVRTNG